MRVVVPNIELMRSGLEENFMTPEQFIEKVGRTCYKSEDKITEDSASKFVGNLIKRGHEAMIEHWNLIFKTNVMWYEEIKSDWDNLMHNGNYHVEEQLRPYLRFSEWTYEDEPRCIISGNMRAWRDYAKTCIEGFGFMPNYMINVIQNAPIFFPEFRDYKPVMPLHDILIPITARDLIGDFEHDLHHDVTFKFICDRGVSHEIVRHRTSSFAQESTRYCNYSGEKFDKCITVVEPRFIGDAYLENKNDIIMAWERACVNAEAEYFKLLELGCTPQEARSVLPNSLKTEVIMTTNLNGWKHFFGLRCAPDAHPDIQVVANMAKELYDAEI